MYWTPIQKLHVLTYYLTQPTCQIFHPYRSYNPITDFVLENMRNKPFGRVVTGLWSIDLKDSLRFPSEDLRCPEEKPILSGFCLTLLYLEETSMSFDTSLLPAPASKENPYVDLKGDLLKRGGLPSRPFESSSRLNGRLSSWLFSSLFLKAGLLGYENPSVVLRGLLSLQIPQYHFIISHAVKCLYK